MKNGFHSFLIVDSASDKLIGTTWISEVNFVNRNAMFGILIGDENFRGKGYAFEAASLVLDYAFNICNLHNVALEVFDFNGRAIKLYEKLGFKTIGRRRASRIVCGKTYDTVYMDILDREFKSPVVAKYIGKND
jgi:RimJ/RimL family protein N-acetyltransferase